MKTQVSKFVATNIVQRLRYNFNAIGRWHKFWLLGKETECYILRILIWVSLYSWNIEIPPTQTIDTCIKCIILYELGVSFFYNSSDNVNEPEYVTWQ